MIEHPEVARIALVESLRTRWSRPLTFIDAGAGFGKSTLLRQVMADNQREPRGTDFALRVTPAMNDASLLAGALLGVLEPSGPTSDYSVTELVDRIGEHSPLDVCIVLDDVHHLDESQSGAHLLADLVASLPANGHLLVAGRTPPPFPTARLRLMRLAKRIDEAALGFATEEVDQLAQLYGRNSDDLRDMGSWPALADLAARGERVDGTALLAGASWRLSARQRDAIKALLVLGSFDAAALAKAVGAADTAELDLHRIPMVLGQENGEVIAHDLWRDVLDPASVDETLLVRLTELVPTVARMAELFDHGVDNQRPDLTRAIVVRTLAAMPLAATPSLLRHWSSAFESHRASDDPVWLLLEGSLAIADGAGDKAVDLLLGAQQGFEHDGTEVGEVAALGRLIQHARVTEDNALLATIFHRVSALAVRWPQMRATTDFVTAAIHENAGEFDQAIDVLEKGLRPSLDTSTRVLMRQYQVWLAMLSGRIEDFREAAVANAVEEQDRRAHVDGYLSLVDWFSGKPIKDDMIRSEGDLGLARHHFVHATNRSMMAVSVGSGDLASDEELSNGASGSPADRFLIAIVEAACAVHSGDESQARRILSEAARELGTPTGVGLGHLLRFAAYPVVLCPELLADAMPATGAEHRARIATAQTLVDLRSGRDVNWKRVPDQRWWVTSLPLAWSAELAVRAYAAGQLPTALRALDLLDHYCGKALRPQLERIRRSHPDLADAASSLASILPGAPAGDVVLRISGGLSIEHEWVGLGATKVNRPKVVQLLILLLALGPTTRDRLVDALWPQMTTDRGMRNLRTSLSYLRKLLEPDRRPEQPSAFVIDRGDTISVASRPELVVDVDRIRRLVARAKEAESSGTSAEVLESCRSAVSFWKGDFAGVVRGPSLIDSYLDAAVDDVVWAYATLGEAALAREQLDDAMAAASEALLLRPEDRRLLGLAVVVHRRLNLEDEARGFARRLLAAAGPAGLDAGSAMICRSVGVGVERSNRP